MRKLNISFGKGIGRRFVCLFAFFLAVSLFVTGCGRRSSAAELIPLGGREESVVEDSSSGDSSTAGEGSEAGEDTGSGTASTSGEGFGSGTASTSGEDLAAGNNSGDQNLEGTVFVYICGQVKKPGVYELPTGSRICDAAEAAGGLTEEAAPDAQNLAELLCDGEMIYIPTEEEAREQGLGGLNPGQENMDAGKGGDSSPGSVDTSKQTGETGQDGRININTASKEELMTLSGIGESRAEAILEYRQKNGSFASKEDITQVSGIGAALFDSIKDKITVK